MKPTLAAVLRSCLVVVAMPACQAVVEPDEVAIEAALAELSSSPTCTARKLEAFSTSADEGRLVFSLDGREAYFHRLIDGALRLMESHREHGGWSTPVPMALNTGHGDLDPFLSLDGDTLYFASFRPSPGSTVPRADADLWKAARLRGGGWAAPVPVPDVNTTHNELFPSVIADSTLYFNTDRPGGAGAWDLYTARRRAGGFHPPQPLRGQVNTPIWEFNPSLTPGGRLLAFGSLDPDPAAPYSDVFFAVRLPGGYSARVNAGPCVNTLAEEYHPTIDFARGRLVFVRNDPFSPINGDLYEVSLPGLIGRD